MSIIREFIEYYRLPSIVKNNLDKFDNANNITDGTETRTYSTEGVSPKTMTVVQSVGGVEYRTLVFTYNDNDFVSNVQSICNGKTTTEIYTYDNSNRITNIVTSTVSQA